MNLSSSAKMLFIAFKLLPRITNSKRPILKDAHCTLPIFIVYVFVYTEAIENMTVHNM